MADMSDLDLVAQAMAPTDKPSKPKTDPTSPRTTKTQSESSIDPSSQIPDLGDDNLDLSSLTPEDLAMLQPLLSALSMSDSDVLDENSLADVWKQMSAAGEVADDLEGKLDRLIGELGKAEEDILGGMGDKSRAKGQGEKGDEERNGDVRKNRK